MIKYPNMMRNYIYALLCFLILTACKKDDDVAPPITVENTFSCKINGALFIPADFGSFPNSFDGIVSYIPQNTKNWYFRFSNRDVNIYIYIVNVENTGNYILKLSDGDGDFFEEESTVCEIDINGTNLPTHHSIDNSGVIQVLELEINNKIILQFDELKLLNNNDPNDVIILTEGKLNINLETL